MFTHGLAPNQIKTALDMVFRSKIDSMEGPNMAKVTDSDLFVQSTTDRAAEIVENMTDGGLWTQRLSDTEDLAETTITTGDKKTYSVVNFSQSLPISKHLIDDEQWGSVRYAVGNMAYNAGRSRLKTGFEAYRNAFTTFTANNGIALISDTQSNLNGDVIDNKISGALSESTLNDAINALVEQKNQSGVTAGHQASCLLVPNRLFKTACEITDSEMRSGTANNDINAYSSKYGIYVKQSNFLGSNEGGSDTAWFLLSNNHGITRWVRQGIETEYVPYQYSSNYVSYYKGEYREMYGAMSYEGIVGSTGV